MERDIRDLAPKEQYDMVVLAIDAIKDDVRKLGPGRESSIILTKLDEAKLWMCEFTAIKVA